MKVLIVGGVAGGASTLARLRRLDERAEIVMVERGKYISFANCGLPYHIGGVIKNRENLLVEIEEGLEQKFNVDIRVETEAITIDRSRKVVVLKNLHTGVEYEESYDKLVLSPGSIPFIPDLPGINSRRVHSLRNMSDMDGIIEYINTHKVKNAIVVGGGFIGVETAENLFERGIDVAVVERAPQILGQFDWDFAQMAHEQLADHGIKIYLETSVEGFEEVPDGVKVILDNDSELEAQLVILSIGVVPESKLAVDAGLDIGHKGAIIVNENLLTSDPDIYAVGDAIQVTCQIRNEPILVPLAWGANRQGRLCADNICGMDKKFSPQLGTSILKVFDYTGAATGLSAFQLEKAGIEFKTVVATRNNHAGYYPGAFPMMLKLHYAEDGTILGAQGFGLDGVDKRIDVIATAIKGNLKAWDLQDIEVAYAPPFNSAKDPVNILGYMAENRKTGMEESITWKELVQVQDKVQILDIRTYAERSLGHIENDIHIELNDLRTRIEELDKGKEYVVYCAMGHRGYIAFRILKQYGFRVRNLIGGYKLYKYAFSSFEPKDVAAKKDKHYLESNIDISKRIVLDACGLQCPGPIMKTKEAMETLENGQLLEVKASDPGFKKDVYHWADSTGNQVIETSFEKGIVTAILQKGTGRSKNIGLTVEKNGQTIVVFSGDLDKVLASMIIANGALAMGKDVTLFFTFWGLNALRRKGTKVKKPLLEKMFGAMMPEGMDELKISKMNMGGMGTALMKSIMQEKNVDSLDTHLKSFLKNGGKIIACTMSMDVLGITKDELIDGIEYAGVASYLGEAEKASSNLFI